jgi:hypothetical protein
MFSSSGHRGDDANYNGIHDRLEIGEVLLPVLSQYGVQLVFGGHEHGYERFLPTQGVHAITTAGGGVRLYALTELDAASALFWARDNCVKVTIDGDQLEAQALGTRGEVFDTMTIQRRLPPPRIYQSAWHSPVIESAPANDNDGNLINQVFDFAGEPIPALTGQFSNLGLARVNNDRTHLYIGFEQVMIRCWRDPLSLCGGSKRLPGVASLFARRQWRDRSHGAGRGRTRLSLQPVLCQFRARHRLHSRR